VRGRSPGLEPLGLRPALPAGDKLVHRRAVDSLSDDVGVAGVARKLLHEVERDPAHRPALDVLGEPRCVPWDRHRGVRVSLAQDPERLLGLLVEAEWTAREQRRLTQRLRHAKLRYPACLEDVDFTTPRGLTRDMILSLGTGAWIRDHHNLLITGPTGIGKSWLASAFVQSACRHGFTATYVRAPRLLHELAVSRGDGSYARLLAKLAKLQLLAIDDWLLAALTEAERRDLLEVIEDRSERVSTLIASQLPPTAWHAAIGEPSVADAICDRLIHRAHKLTLKGPTMRDPGTRRDGKSKS